MAATSRTLNELIEMDPLERSYLFFWVREREFDQMQQISRMLGVMFKAGEVRSWKEGSGDSLDDEDHLFVPLTFMLRPEAREGVKKMVGNGLPLTDYRKAPNEVVVDLGQVSPEEFKEFVQKHRVKPPES